MSIFQLENRSADYWHELLKDVRQAQETLRRTARRMAGGVAERGAARIETYAKTPCLTYALR